MTDDQIDALVADLAERALAGTDSIPAVAAVALLDAACCIMVTHMPAGAARKLAPTYGAYMADQIATVIGGGRILQ